VIYEIGSIVTCIFFSKIVREVGNEKDVVDLHLDRPAGRSETLREIGSGLFPAE